MTNLPLTYRLKWILTVQPVSALCQYSLKKSCHLNVDAKVILFLKYVFANDENALCLCWFLVEGQVSHIT